MKKSNKKLIAAGIIAAAALFIFLAYPLLFCAINYPGIVKEKNRVMEYLGDKGFEVYSGKAFVYTDMYYISGYIINYHTEYVVVFKSDMTDEELREELPSLLISPLAEAEAWNRNEKLVKRTKQPKNKDGYYVAWFPYKSTVDETKATRLHTLFYADAENREEMEEERKYLMEFFK